MYIYIYVCVCVCVYPIHSVLSAPFPTCAQGDARTGRRRGLVNPVYDMDMCLFKVDVFIQQANMNIVFFALRIQHVRARRRLRLLSVIAPLLALCSCEWFVLLSCACAYDLLIF